MMHLGLTPGGEGLALDCQCDQRLETFGFGITAAGLPFS